MLIAWESPSRVSKHIIKFRLLELFLAANHVTMATSDLDAGAAIYAGLSKLAWPDGGIHTLLVT